MKRLLTLLTLLGACLYAGAQKKAVAVIEAYDAAFTLQSAVTGTLHVRYTVTVQDKAGLREAAVYIYTDTFASLGSFSGEIVSATGEKTKLSRKDLTSVAYSSGLVDDGFLHAYAPSQAMRLPLTVTYDYTLQYKKGVISFPAFAPLDGAGVQLKRASCSIEVPEGTQIIQYAAHVEAHDPVTEKKRTVYRWEAGPVGPFADEEMAPPAFERIPLVLAAPVDFSYAGTKGTQSGWKEYGAWLYSLQEGADSLPDELTARLQEMTRGCKTPLEKLKVLYGFLRKQTRYVSIQLGIGGLKPAPAEEVARTGYGDCKALSNYLKALLKAVGVSSEYYIIHTDRKDLLPGFTTVGQMNHAMLAVPLPEQQDTVFVECTNPLEPLGYRHRHAAGHEAVLIGPDGGKLFRIGSYPDSLRRRIQETEVSLSENGEASVQIRRHLYLDYIEPYLDFSTWKEEDRTRILTGGMKFQTERLRVESITDNFDTYAGQGTAFCPEMTFGYRFFTRSYATTGSGRIFVPVNPVSKGLSWQKAAREEAFVATKGYVTEDRILLRIPAGYTVESLPEPVVLDSEWGVFRSEAVAEDNAVRITQRYEAKPFQCENSRYEAYREFARKVGKQYDAQLILKRVTDVSAQ